MNIDYIVKLANKFAEETSPITQRSTDMWDTPASKKSKKSLNDVETQLIATFFEIKSVCDKNIDELRHEQNKEILYLSLEENGIEKLRRLVKTLLNQHIDLGQWRNPDPSFEYDEPDFGEEGIANEVVDETIDIPPTTVPSTLKKDMYPLVMSE